MTTPKYIRVPFKKRWHKRISCITLTLFLLFVSQCGWLKGKDKPVDVEEDTTPPSPSAIDSSAMRHVLDTNGFHEKSIYDYAIWKNGRIHEIIIDNSQLEVLPDTIRAMQFLNTIKITNTNLKHVTSQIYAIGKLRVIDFSRCKLDSMPTVLSVRHWSHLNLSHNNITDFPHIKRFYTLQELDLSHNKIEALPDSIDQYLYLTKMNLENNQLRKIPDSLQSLSPLKYLNISGNQIKVIPPTIQHLENLEEFNFSNNQIKNLPSELFQLSNLRILSFSNNNVSTIHDSLSGLKLLHTLMADRNDIYLFPTAIKDLPALKILHLHYNRIANLPIHSKHPKLTDFFINNNDIAQIPSSLIQSPQLANLNLANNRLTNIPDAIDTMPALEQLSISGNDVICALSNPQLQFLRRFKGDLEMCEVDSLGFYKVSKEEPRNHLWGQVLYQGSTNPKDSTAHPEKLPVAGVFAVFYSMDGDVVDTAYSNDSGYWSVDLPRGTFIGGLVMKSENNFQYFSISLDTFALGNLLDSIEFPTKVFTYSGPKENQENIRPHHQIFIMQRKPLPDTVLRIPFVNFPLDSSEIQFILEESCHLGQQRFTFEGTSVVKVEWGSPTIVLEKQPGGAVEAVVVPEYSATISAGARSHSLVYKVSPALTNDKKDNDGDGCIDEELLDGVDNDNDMLIDEDLREIHYKQTPSLTHIGQLLHPDSVKGAPLTYSSDDIILNTNDSTFWGPAFDHLESRLFYLEKQIKPRFSQLNQLQGAQNTIGGCWKFYNDVFDFKPLGTVFKVSQNNGPDSIIEVVEVYYPLDSLDALTILDTACGTEQVNFEMTESLQGYEFSWGDSMSVLTESGFEKIPRYTATISKSSSSPIVKCNASDYQPADNRDNDGDGCVDEELKDSLDNDNDGLIDEDIRDGDYLPGQLVLYHFLHPDSLTGPSITIDSNSVLSFTQQADFWRPQGNSTLARMKALEMEPTLGAVDSITLMTLEATVGGCWSYYRELFDFYVPGTEFLLSRPGKIDTIIKEYDIFYPLDSVEIVKLAQRYCNLPHDTVELLEQANDFFLTWGTTLSTFTDSGLFNIPAYMAKISIFQSESKIVCSEREYKIGDKKDNDGDGCIDEEILDSLDNDGDGLVDEGFTDTDGDGIADCIDTEECDGLDNDGDGLVDEGFDQDGDGVADCFDICPGFDDIGECCSVVVQKPLSILQFHIFDPMRLGSIINS